MAKDDARRLGMIVLAASFVGHIGNYLYYVIAARMVTPPEFSAISALISFGTIIMMPVNGVQVAVARDVALLRTSSTEGALSAYLRRLGIRMAITCVVVFAVIAGLAPAYTAAKPLLAPLALVMTGAAVLWVHLTFATAKRSRKMTVGLVVTAVAHWILLVFLHHSPQQIIVASGIAIGCSLVAIEIGSGSGIVRMLRGSSRVMVSP